MLSSTLLRASTVRRYYDNHYPKHIEFIEDLLRAVSLVLPGTLQHEYEPARMVYIESNKSPLQAALRTLNCVRSQAIISVLNLFLHYHTHLLARHRAEKGDACVFNKHIETYYRSEWPSKAASLVLSVVSCTEVVYEMLLARRVQNKGQRWRWIAGLEGFKAILRLILLFRSGRRTVVHPTHLVRNTDQADKVELATLDPRSGLPSTGLLGTSAMQPRRGWALVGEILWIVRPAIYAYLVLDKVKNKPEVKADDEQDEAIEKDDENDWRPWLTSALIDVTARIARTTQAAAVLEREEFTRRDYLLLYYFLRRPAYNLFTKRLLDTFCDVTEHRPLVSVIATALNDYRPFWEQLYFYTAAS